MSWMLRKELSDLLDDFEAGDPNLRKMRLEKILRCIERYLDHLSSECDPRKFSG